MHKIATSPNNSTWTTVKTVTGENGGVDDHTGLSATGRYVRITGTTRATAWGCSLWEFEVYGTSGPTNPTPTNVAQGKTATASSQEAAYTPAMAVDGSGTTRWSSAFSDPQWIQVDLGQTYIHQQGATELGGRLRQRLPDPDLAQRLDVDHDQDGDR